MSQMWIRKHCSADLDPRSSAASMRIRIKMRIQIQGGKISRFKVLKLILIPRCNNISSYATYVDSGPSESELSDNS